MLLGNSEHVADDRDRQAEGKILDQVHVALARNAIQSLVDHLLNARTHVLDPARRKRFHHQAAQPRVVGRILLQHPVAHAAKNGLLEDLGSIAPAGALDKILAEAPVAQNQAGFGMAAGDESAERGEVHRIGGAQPFIMRIWISNELRRQRVKERLGRRSLNMLVHGPSAIRFISNEIKPTSRGCGQVRRCRVLVGQAAASIKVSVPGATGPPPPVPCLGKPARSPPRIVR